MVHGFYLFCPNLPYMRADLISEHWPSVGTIRELSNISDPYTGGPVRLFDSFFFVVAHVYFQRKQTLQGLSSIK